jgi:hypothetical protein
MSCLVIQLPNSLSHPGPPLRLGFLCCQYMYCCCRPNYQERSAGFSITGLILPHFCACSKTGPGFTNVICFSFIFNCLRCSLLIIVGQSNIWRETFLSAYFNLNYMILGNSDLRKFYGDKRGWMIQQGQYNKSTLQTFSNKAIPTDHYLRH